MSRLLRRWWVGVVLLASLRLAHVNLLWADEDYHLAAALQMLHGRLPYRDFWYDKPPLAALFYCLIGGYAGWPLRLLDIAFMLACCCMAYKLARAWWGESEGRTAALLLAFYTTFYLPAATIPFAVDGLLLLPHLAAVYFALKRRAFWSGVCCAAGLLTNVKAVFVVATCALWLLSDVLLFAAGMALPLGLAAVMAAVLGLLPGFYREVWQWGLLYTRGSATAGTFGLGVKRSADWLAFHAALLAGVSVVSRDQSRDERFKLGVWFVFSAAALLLGNHFAPRYFFQLLPVMVIAGARGVVLGLERYGRAAAAALAVLLLVPLVRFGPRYAELALDNLEHRRIAWSDVAMDIDSQRAADIINARKRPGDTLFVWGYRPDLYVYTRLVPPELFWDSQPLDGVPADRHLQSSLASSDVAVRENRALLVASKPRFVVDGLGLLNPGLRPQNFPEVAEWLRNYRLIGETRLCRIYER
jgi:hypothetical protein